MKTVYLVSAEINGSVVYKIGWTSRTPEDRIKEFKTGNASDMYLVDSFKSKWATKIESHLHRYFKDKSLSGEWFALTEFDVEKFQFLCERADNNFKVLAENNLYVQNKGLL